MDYQQTIHYLYNTLPMFSRMGSAAYKKDLTNIKALCEHLGNPQKTFKSIHIAGTNGKGSVSHMLAAVLEASGYKTGLYTSPHLKDFRERIKINGEEVPESFVIQFVEDIRPVADVVHPSFFEITVAMAFHYFAQQRVDVAVIEVGLGGRLDSTNIIEPILSIITNIGLDHTDMLGNTLAQIAVEKGGIIKQGIPVVIGERQMETEPVFKEIAARLNAPITFAEDTIEVLDYSLKEDHLEVQCKNRETGIIDSFLLDLGGLYQTKNIRTVLQSIGILKSLEFDLPEQKIKEALAEIKARTGLGGRWQVLQRAPKVVLEVAHNAAGIQQMLQHVNSLTYNQLHLIIGMVRDKDVTAVLQALPAEATYYFTQAAIPRALAATELEQKAVEIGLNGMVCTDVNTALKTALKNAHNTDLIIVCGSIFLVAEVVWPLP